MPQAFVQCYVDFKNMEKNRINLVKRTAEPSNFSVFRNFTVMKKRLGTGKKLLVLLEFFNVLLGKPLILSLSAIDILITFVKSSIKKQTRL